MLSVMMMKLVQFSKSIINKSNPKEPFEYFWEGATCVIVLAYYLLYRTLCNDE